MKYIISESQVNNLIKKYFKKDLSSRIKMITSHDDLPRAFRESMPRYAINHFLNSFGPMFLIRTDNGDFLAQDRIEQWTIADEGDTEVTEDHIMRMLGIAPLGLSMQELIDAYIEE